MIGSFSKLKQVLNDTESREVLLYVNKCDEFGLDPSYINQLFMHTKTGEVFTLVGMRKIGTVFRVVLAREPREEISWCVTVKELKDSYKLLK